jgi:hypothetical protein
MSVSKRLLAVVIAVLGMVLAAVSFSASAGAAPPPGSSTGSGTSPVVTTQTPPAGGQLGVSGQGCGPFETIDISLDNGAFPLGTTQTDSSGAYDTTVTLPDGVTGPHTLSVVGETSGCSGALALNITAAGSGGGGGTSGGGGGSLASTGVAVAGIGAVGLVLLVGGGLMLLAGRRRKASA